MEESTVSTPNQNANSELCQNCNLSIHLSVLFVALSGCSAMYALIFIRSSPLVPILSMVNMPLLWGFSLCFLIGIPVSFLIGFLLWNQRPSLAIRVRMLALAIACISITLFMLEEDILAYILSISSLVFLFISIGLLFNESNSRILGIIACAITFPLFSIVNIFLVPALLIPRVNARKDETDMTIEPARLRSSCFTSDFYNTASLILCILSVPMAMTVSFFLFAAFTVSME